MLEGLGGGIWFPGFSEVGAFGAWSWGFGSLFGICGFRGVLEVIS